MADSDWKSRAQALPTPTAAAPAASDWKSRAQAVGSAAKLPDEGTYLGAADAGLTGAANGATFGYVPQITGAMKAAFAPADQSFTDAYADARDEELKREKSLQQNHPIAYGAGSVAGAFAAPLPGTSELALAKEAPLIAKLAVGGAKGAATGFIQNPGDDPNSNTVGDPQLAQRLHNATTGGVLGLAGETASQAVQGVAPTVERWMTTKTLGANKGEVKQLLKNVKTPDGLTPRVDQIQDFMDQNGMLNMGSNFSTAVDKSSQIMDNEGKRLQGIYSSVDQRAASNPQLQQALQPTQMNGPNLAQEFFDNEKKILMKKDGGQAALSRLQDDLGLNSLQKAIQKGGSADDVNGLAGLGPDVSLQDMHGYRMSVDDQVPFGSDTTGKLLAQSKQRLRTFLNNKMQARVGAADSALQAAGEDSNLLPQLKEANQNYFNASTVNKIAANSKAGEWTKYAPGLIGAAGGLGYAAYDMEHGEDPLHAIGKGIALGAGLRASRILLPSITYRGTQGLSSALQNNPMGAQRALISPWIDMTKGAGNGAQ